MSGLLNSNKSAPNDKLFYILGVSGFLFTSLLATYILNKKIFERNADKFLLLAIFASFLFCTWAAIYGAAWMAAQYPPDNNDPNSIIDNNYLYTFYGASIAPVLLFLMYSFAIALKSLKFNYSEALFISIIFGILLYTGIAISYYMSISARDSQSFPLSTPGIRGSSDHFSQNADNYRIGYIAIGVTAFVFSILYAYQSISNRPFKFSLLTEKIIHSLTVLSFIILISYSIIIESFISLPDNSGPQSEYSVYLIITTFTILSSIFIGLITFGKTNFISRKDSNFYNGLVAVCGSIALILSITNTVFTYNQSVSITNFTDERLANGTKIADHNEKNYDLLNFSMGYNYLATGILSLILIILASLSWADKRKDLLNMSKFFSIQYNLTYGWYSFLLLIAVLAVTGLSIFLGIRYGENNPDAFKLGKIEEDSGWVPMIATLSVLTLSYLMERFINLGSKPEEESTFVLKIFNLFILAFILFIPVICFIIYLISTPKFYTKVITDSNEQDLIFGDIIDNNGIADIDGKTSDSIFKVSSNFVSSGNGLFITGGRTSLDLATTRNIRYVDNQADYYNSKFLYQDIDFKEISKNDLNLFSLETNQISYGDNNNNINNAYWVAAGENIGLGDCLYYNTTAGANNDQNIPEIQELNNWYVADSGEFGYKANGVISGVNSNNNRWVAVGQNSVDFSDNLNIKYSDDGKNWLNCTGASFNGYGNKVAFGPSGLVVSSGIKNTNTFIAVGYDTLGVSTILRSIDGKAWQSTTNNFNGEGKAVAYGMSSNGTSGIWVAVGSDTSSYGVVKYSLDDGQTWKNSGTSFDFTKPDDANTVTYNFKKKKFFVGGKKGKNNVLYSSQNGNTWSVVNGFNNFDEITAVGYNLLNAETSVDYSKSLFNQVYYPYINNQQFFVDKVESDSLKYFLFGNYLATFIMVLLTFLIMYLISKDKYLATGT